jgi:uncharacterized protein (DUF1778 family)
MAHNKKQIHVYVSEEERDLLRVRAAGAGLSVSKYLLMCSLSAPQVAKAGAQEPKRVRVSKPDRSTEVVEKPDSHGSADGRGFLHYESTVAKRKRLGKL